MFSPLPSHTYYTHTEHFYKQVCGVFAALPILWHQLHFIQFSFVTTYLELASDPTSKRFNPKRLPTLQTPKTSPSLSPLQLTSYTFSRISHKNQVNPYLLLHFILKGVIRDLDEEVGEELNRVRPGRFSVQELLWLWSWGVPPS